jgi:hypothetical protein
MQVEGPSSMCIDVSALELGSDISDEIRLIMLAL